MIGKLCWRGGTFIAPCFAGCLLPVLGARWFWERIELGCVLLGRRFGLFLIFDF
ncbi:hypothetical protein CEV32_1361 [Brucella rhizosphaerae]|uniref:Uncharacterized protein n=1 Tax=Brucella rhizosphaerae TaxID=571254 RepID=A0A256FAD0_9HYPH|nr:hypothetical protein CEV32_1361 [Brucella rhizosphaerae]